MTDGYAVRSLTATYDYKIGMTLEEFTEELIRLAFEATGRGYEVRFGGRVTVRMTPAVKEDKSEGGGQT